MTAMTAAQILIASDYCVEFRKALPTSTEFSAQSAWRLFYFYQPDKEEFSCLLVNPGQTVCLSRAQMREGLLLIEFAPQFLLEIAARLRLHPAGAHLLFRQPLMPISGEVKLSATLQTIREEMIEAAAGWREIIASLMNQLAIQLLRSHINVQRSDDIELSRVGIVDRRLRRAIEFMHDHCQRELTLAEIAAAAYLSEFHFARLFKKITGTTPHAFLATLRIEKARRMLAESDLSISDIGAQVGYASQSHFTRIFRQTVGLTPRAFRQAAQGKISS
jgi:AraC family transcriptional regulator